MTIGRSYCIVIQVLRKHDAAVAQSVERRIGSAEVTGPIPVSSFHIRSGNIDFTVFPLFVFEKRYGLVRDGRKKRTPESPMRLEVLFCFLLLSGRFFFLFVMLRIRLRQLIYQPFDHGLFHIDVEAQQTDEGE